MKIISGSSNLDLAKLIAQNLKTNLVDRELTKFANGESRILIKDNISNQNIILVQSFSNPVNTHIIESLLLTDALERAGAKNITLLAPWLGYSLQDKIFRDGEALAAKVIAQILSTAHFKKIILFDLHNPSIPGFFNTPTQNLTALNLFANYAKQNFDLKNSVVVSPDFGGLKRSREISQKLNLNLAHIDKSRDLKTGRVTINQLSGDIKNKICLIYDDVINTGGTVVETAKFLKKQGAKQVHFLVTHGLFAGDGLKKMQDKNINQIIITNSIFHQNLNKKIKILDASKVFVKALKS